MFIEDLLPFLRGTNSVGVTKYVIVIHGDGSGFLIDSMKINHLEGLNVRWRSLEELEFILTGESRAEDN